jgi:tetratricopeptide (TPR) repeat protein
MRYTQARAEIALAQGDWDAALGWSADAVAQSRARGRIKYQTLALQTRAATLSALGQTRGAISCLRRAVDLARRLDDPAVFVQAASEMLALDGDNALAWEAASAIERILAGIADERLRHQVLMAEPVRRVMGLASVSAANRDHFQVVARDDDRLVV